MAYGRRITRILERTKVAELVTLTRAGGVDVRPMSAVWLPDRERLLLTTPAAFAQKVRNVRRDGRVALLFSDPTGTGLDEALGVLAQGTAVAPDVVLAPQDLPEFWRGAFGKHPDSVQDTFDEAYRRTMDWYYWRLPIEVTPERVVTLPAEPYGGRRGRSPAPGAPLAEQVADALHRYPTAVLAARDASGRPYAARARVVDDGGDGGAGRLALHTATSFEGVTGPAALLWHRHDGHAGDMASLQVAGRLTVDPDDPARAAFAPERIPGATPGRASRPDGRQRALAYLDRQGLPVPDVDWDALAAFAREARAAAA